ncbi:MAG: hypothetical protein OXB93_07130, partial [Cytophagales bacterium]|nr:hypothetical protein [Cytophagales bacterium]
DYICYLGSETRLPMMDMEDAVAASLSLMQVPPERIRIRTSYNIGGLSFTPREVETSIRDHGLPHEWKVHYKPDPLRQGIAEGWPETIEDKFARKDWGFQSQCQDLSVLTRKLLCTLRTEDVEGGDEILGSNGMVS